LKASALIMAVYLVFSLSTSASIELVQGGRSAGAGGKDNGPAHRVTEHGTGRKQKKKMETISKTIDGRHIRPP